LPALAGPEKDIEITAIMSLPVTIQIGRNHSGESWGFRLQGGSDFREELSVKKVSPNTPASMAGLTQGDAIVAIGPYETNGMTHAQASQMIKQSGDILQLTVQKGSLNTLRPRGPLKFSMASANTMVPAAGPSPNRDTYKRF
jgi:predicted metalloprotease with PDZ domain